MQATGVRRLLILLFAIINIVFLCMYVYEYRANEYVSEDFVNSAVENLTERAIVVSADVFDRRIPSLRASKIVSADRDENGKAVSNAVVRYTLGNADIRFVEFETPEGVSLSFYDKDDEASRIQLAKTVYSKDSFSFKYSDFRYEKEAEAPTEFIETISRDISYDEKKILENLVICLGKSTSLGYRIAGCKGYEDGTVFTLVQTFDGVDVRDMHMNVLVWNGEILSANGNWISEKTEKNFKYDMTDGINAVFELELDNVGEIVSERCVYVLRRSDESTYYLLPVWEIQYVDVDGTKHSVVIENTGKER